MCNDIVAPDTTIDELYATIRRLSWNSELNMLNGAGIREAIRNLPEGHYIVVFFDIDHLKQINSATRNHFATNRYLREGLHVRKDEIIGQLYGDEIVAIIDESGGGGRRQKRVTVEGFIARIQRQLDQVPIPSSVRCALGGRGLSATASGMRGVRPADMLQAIEWLSQDVLAKKAERDVQRAAA